MGPGISRLTDHYLNKAQIHEKPPVRRYKFRRLSKVLDKNFSTINTIGIDCGVSLPERLWKIPDPSTAYNPFRQWQKKVAEPAKVYRSRVFKRSSYPDLNNLVALFVNQNLYQLTSMAPEINNQKMFLFYISWIFMVDKNINLSMIFTIVSKFRHFKAKMILYHNGKQFLTKAIFNKSKLYKV